MSHFPSALILDFDGVIGDTERLHLAAFQHVLAAHGVELKTEEYFARYLGLDDRDVIRSAARDGGVSLDTARIEAALRDKAALYARTIATAPVLYDGVERRLREWSRELPLAIATGSLRSEIETILGRYDLRGCFAAIVTAEDVARGKPAPDGYLMALDALNGGGKAEALPYRKVDAGRHHIQPRDVVVVEDSLPGLQAARSAGMRTIAVTTNHPAALLAQADLVVPSLAVIDLQMLARFG